MTKTDLAESLQLLTTEDVAKLLSMKPQTLAGWRCTGVQPLPFLKLGRAVRYRRAAVADFLRTRERGTE